MQTQAIAPEVVEAIDRQVTAFTNRYGGKFPALAEDIRQEAWATALESVHRYDPRHPGAKGYFYMCAGRHVLKRITKWRSLLSLSNEAARHGVEPSTQWRITITGGQGRDEPDENLPGICGTPQHALRATEADPEVSLSIRELNARLAALRVRWRRAVDRATANLSPEEHEIGALAFGLDGPERGPAWIARHLGIWRDEAKRATKVYRQAMRRPKVRALEREIETLEEVLG
jgi:DNA-directed RNA polymerase specialized sigma24 family protein